MRTAAWAKAAPSAHPDPLVRVVLRARRAWKVSLARLVLLVLWEMRVILVPRATLARLARRAQRVRPARTEHPARPVQQDPPAPGAAPAFREYLDQ